MKKIMLSLICLFSFSSLVAEEKKVRSKRVQEEKSFTGVLHKYTDKEDGEIKCFLKIDKDKRIYIRAYPHNLTLIKEEYLRKKITVQGLCEINDYGNYLFLKVRTIDLASRSKVNTDF